MTEFVLNLLDFLIDELVLVVISMMPLIELRGSIPVGLFVYNMNPLTVFFLTYPASLIPAPFIVLFIKYIFAFLSKNAKMKGFIEKIINSNKRKNQAKIEKYGLIGLFIIVAIPLPGTGVWSGSLAAALFDFKFWKAMLVIILGNLVAAFAIMAISMGILSAL